MLIIVNIVFVMFYLQVEPVYLRVSNKPIQITSCVINIGNTSKSPTDHVQSHKIENIQL